MSVLTVCYVDRKHIKLCLHVAPCSIAAQARELQFVVSAADAHVPAAIPPIDYTQSPRRTPELSMLSNSHASIPCADMRSVAWQPAQEASAASAAPHAVVQEPPSRQVIASDNRSSDAQLVLIGLRAEIAKLQADVEQLTEEVTVQSELRAQVLHAV